MNQILHVFRKDVRHHWIVILICQLALLVYCWDEVASWKRLDSFGLNGITQMLLPLCWCFFILRMVQDESLAGDRQFWVTRPYEWKKLLVEKVLLVLAFLNFPALIAGLFLLAKAGFSPGPYVLGLLWMQLLLLLLPFVPFMALAAVTRNLVPALVTLLALILLAVIIPILPLFFRSSGHFSVGFFAVNVDVSSDWSLDSPAIVVASIVSIVLQYARRWTVQSRLWLAGGVVAAVAISMVSAYASRNRDPFPRPANQNASFHAGLDPVKLIPPKRAADPGEPVPIGIPLDATGVPANSLGWVRGMRLVLEGPNGLRWEGRWPGGTQLLAPGDNRWRAMFEMDYEDYQRMRSAPLKGYVSILTSLYHDGGFENVTVTSGEFDVPGVGHCWFWRRNRGTLRCNSPLVRPQMMVARFNPELSSCPAEDVPPPAPEQPLRGLPYAWQRGRDSTLPGAGVNPLATSLLYFWDFSDAVGLCPGTPLEFSFPQFAENVRNDFEIENLNLDDYRKVDFSSPAMTGPDGVRLGLPPAP